MIRQNNGSSLRSFPFESVQFGSGSFWLLFFFSWLSGDEIWKLKQTQFSFYQYLSVCSIWKWQAFAPREEGWHENRRKLSQPSSVKVCWRTVSFDDDACMQGWNDHDDDIDGIDSFPVSAHHHHYVTMGCWWWWFRVEMETKYLITDFHWFELVGQTTHSTLPLKVNVEHLLLNLCSSNPRLRAELEVMGAFNGHPFKAQCHCVGMRSRMRICEYYLHKIKTLRKWMAWWCIIWTHWWSLLRKDSPLDLDEQS